MTNEELTALIAMAKEIVHTTPWYVTHTAPSVSAGPLVCDGDGIFLYEGVTSICETDAAFIVAAANAAPALAEEVLRLRREVKALSDDLRCENCCRDHDGDVTRVEYCRTCYKACSVSLHDTAELIFENRRLRQLIRDAEAKDDAYCQWCGGCVCAEGGHMHDDGCPIPAIVNPPKEVA